MVKLFNVLIGDTDLKEATRLSQKLDLYNFHTETFANANKILSSIQEKSYDIFLTVEFLQGMDVYAICEKIRQINTNLPIILMTKETDKHRITRATQVGVKGFLFQPIPEARLLETLKKNIPISEDELVIKSELPMKWEYNNYGSTEFIAERSANIHHRQLEVTFSGIPTPGAMREFIKDVSNQIFKMANVTSISMVLPKEFHYCQDSNRMVEEVILKLQSSFQFRAKQIRLSGDLFQIQNNRFKKLESFKS
ncbi:MAG: response regulator [Leptospiraceae bacterium]|nr:response regulator [Leptospiraceae bacterium]MCP5512147.1 response regulator [Leptospiraceae bacterium]